MSNEPNKLIPAEELTAKELEGVVGGTKVILPTIAWGVSQPTLGTEYA